MAAEAAPPSRRTDRVVAWLVLLATAAAFAAAFPWLGGRLGTVALVPAEDPWVELDGRVTAEFGMENPVLWVVEARSGTVWNRPGLTAVVELTRGALRIPGVRGDDVMSLASPNVRQVRLTSGGISPEYLMVSVPPTDEAIAALEQRVSSDENLSGTLVTRDGRAAMIVANFAPDAGGVAEAALELAGRVENDSVRVHVVGAPVLLEEARRFASRVRLRLGAAAVAFVLAGALLLGPSRLLAVATSVFLTTAWSILGMTLAGALVWPWSGLALLPAALLAATAAAACERSRVGVPGWPRVLAVGAVVAIGFVLLAALTPPPARAFGVAGAIGSLAAVVAGRVAASLAGGGPQPPGSWTSGGWLSGFAVAFVIAALLGLPLVTTSFALSAYGERYLPESAAESLKSVRRLMAPPTQLAIRVRGESGFVARPEVLQAMDELVATARREPGVERAQSLADIVKLVHRTFNDDDPAYERLPDDRGLIARYLALAYSPAFRRFVDRGLGRSAVWVHLDTDRPDEVSAVIDTLDTQLEREPIPGAEVDAWAGDGAVLVVMARLASALLTGAAALVLGTVLAAALLLGGTAARRIATGAISAAVVTAGGLGWIGFPLDLLTLGLLTGATAAGAGAGAWRTFGASAPLGRLAALEAVLGLVLAATPLGALRVLGLPLLAHAAALLVLRRPDYGDEGF